MSFIAVALWGAFMMGAIFYTQEARHPHCKALSAYLIFATIFTLVAASMFGALTMLLDRLSASLEHPVAATAFLVAVFLPAFFLGRRQIRKPPRVPVLPHQPGARRQFF